MKYKCVGGPMDGKEVETNGESSLYFEALASDAVHAYTLFGRINAPQAFIWQGLIPRVQIGKSEVIRRHPKV